MVFSVRQELRYFGQRPNHFSAVLLEISAEIIRCNVKGIFHEKEAKCNNLQPSTIQNVRYEGTEQKKTGVRVGIIQMLAFFRCEHEVQALINPLNPELNPICYLLALLGAHHFLHVSRIRVKSLTLRLLMSYIYIYIWSTYS